MIKVRHMAQICRDTFAAGYGTAKWGDLSDRQRRMSTFIVNFILANPDATPRSCHNAWMGEMIHNEGFKHGDTADEALRTHPNLVEYDQIDDRTRHTYGLSIAIVRALQAIEDRYENCVPSESTRRPSEQPSAVFNTPEAPSDAHFIGSDPAAQTGPSETVDQNIELTVGATHDIQIDPNVAVNGAVLAQVPYEVDQAVDQAVESIDPPAETDPARAE